MQVAIITVEQKASLEGVLIAPYTYFNLELYDVNDNVCIDSDSIDMCDIQWLKDLPLIEYVPKPNPFNF
jgi:hypothetical protein